MFLFLATIAITVAITLSTDASDAKCEFSMTKNAPKTRHRCPVETSIKLEKIFGKAIDEKCRGRMLTIHDNILIVGDSIDKQLFHMLAWVQGDFRRTPESLLLSTSGKGISNERLEKELTPVGFRLHSGGTIIFCRDDLRRSFGGYSGHGFTRNPHFGLFRNISSVGTWSDGDCLPDKLGRVANVTVHHVFIGGNRHNFYKQEKGRMLFMNDLQRVVTFWSEYLQLVSASWARLGQEYPGHERKKDITLTFTTIPPTNLIENKLRMWMNAYMLTAAQSLPPVSRLNKGKGVLDIATYGEELLESNAQRLGVPGLDPYLVVGPNYRMAGACDIREEDFVRYSHNLTSQTLTPVSTTDFLKRPCPKEPFLMIEGTHFCPAAVVKWGNSLVDMIWT